MQLKEDSFCVEGTIADLEAERLFPGVIRVEDGQIVEIQEGDTSSQDLIIPGFVDAHIHIESSMLSPSAFAAQAVIHGTVAVVADPHEIANVRGLHGIRNMIEDGRRVPFKFYWGAPSCVPASIFETAGAELGEDEIRELLQIPEVICLAEMMNWPGVINGDVAVLAKLQLAQQFGKVIDGHAPGLNERDIETYSGHGISTDHESFSYDEAVRKLNCGMKIWIREGSAARNLEALFPLIDEFPGQVAFCSDDKHPDDLAVGHLNDLLKRVMVRGASPFKALRAACLTPVEHYGLNVGLIRKGDPADFVVTDGFANFGIRQTYIDGQLVAQDGKSLIEIGTPVAINHFSSRTLAAAELTVESDAELMKVIVVKDGEIMTGEEIVPTLTNCSEVLADPSRDILKLVVVNRYQHEEPAVAFVKNFGLKRGALASSIAHDSHNIVAVGVSDEDLVAAINAVFAAHGGIAVSDGTGKIDILKLPIGGLMSDTSCPEVAYDYRRLDKAAKDLGASLRAPFMTLSFLALPVVPKLKLTNKGLFDGERFAFTSLFS